MLHGHWALSLFSHHTSFVHDFQDEIWDHPPCQHATFCCCSQAAVELINTARWSFPRQTSLRITSTSPYQ